MPIASRCAFIRLPTPHTSSTSVFRSVQSRLKGWQMSYPARLVEQALGGVVRELGEGFSSGDADTQGNGCSLVDSGPDLAAEGGQVAGYAGQVGEGFVDAVDLKRRDHGLNDDHHPFAHVAVQDAVAAERDHAIAAQMVLYLEVRLAHLYKGLGIVTARDHAAVVVRKHHNRDLSELRARGALTACVEAIAVN